MGRFASIGVIMNEPEFDISKLDDFVDKVQTLRKEENWIKQDIIDLFFNLLPDFAHKETGKYLDQRM
jgi:hypothetical protein